MSDERVAVVTGAASGIGAAVVRRLLGAGLRVAALDVSEPALAELARTADPSRIAGITVDVGDAAAVSRAAAAVDAAFGRVDALVTCAGVFARTPALRSDPAAVDRILRVNLQGVLNATASFGPIMARARHGRIVHVASVAAAGGAALAAAYAASKAGVVAVAQSHARELAGDGISVNAVLPGYCNTPMAEPERATLERFVVPKIPLRRLAEPDEIAEVIEFLATCRTGYLTGASILVDGGLRAG